MPLPSFKYLRGLGWQFDAVELVDGKTLEAVIEQDEGKLWRADVKGKGIAFTAESLLSPVMPI